MTTLIDRYRVCTLTDPPHTLLMFATRTAAESYLERAREFLSNPVALQEWVGGQWVNLELTEVRP